MGIHGPRKGFCVMADERSGGRSGNVGRGVGEWVFLTEWGFYRNFRVVLVIGMRIV